MDPPLTELALKYGTDKYKIGKELITGEGMSLEVGGHQYAPHYDFHFEPFRHREINVLEIGVGGYKDPKAGGESLRMWKEYFPKAQIVSLDIHDKTALQEDRIRIYQGSQDDAALLQRMHEECGGFDIIIDDGSHRCDHVITSFQILFPLLKTGGIYAAEDLQTSYWDAMGGSSTDLTATTSSVGFFKSLVDGLNHVEYVLPGYKPTYFDKHIVSMTFYHNMVVIYKGDNDEESNVVVNNEMPKVLTDIWARSNQNKAA